MSRKKKILWILTTLAVLYVGSYSVMSLRGHYKPLLFGLIEGTNGEAILAPKASLDPYRWHPFEVHRDGGGPTALAIVYFPLLIADMWLVHRPELADTGRYRVENYFDWDLMDYRDVNPN